MPQMGPMKWLIFLFIMMILVVIFIVMMHDSGLEKIGLEKGKEMDDKVKKWW